MTTKQKPFFELIGGHRPVLVDFSAAWCGPCKMMEPVLQELKGLTGDKAVIVKIDVDKSPDIAARYRVQSVPTLIIFKQGAVCWRQSGVMRAGQLHRIISQYQE